MPTPPLTKRQFLERIERLSVWKRRGERAPHKPLLVLYALSRLAAGEEAIPFRLAEEHLRRLLEEFGPRRSVQKPELPFWHLRTDGIWTLQGDHPLEGRDGNHCPPLSSLRSNHTVGAFTPEIISLLSGHPELISQAAQRILAAHFPQSLHQDLLDAVGLELEFPSRPRSPRDRAFRERVLTAYERRCAVCGLDVRLGTVTIAIEAAHIQWHQAAGPDIEPNGLSLCSLHHKVFDFGGFTVDEDLRVRVSTHLTGHGTFDDFICRFHGQPLRRPNHPEHHPGTRFLEWHQRQVFKGESRHLLQAD